MTFIIILTTVLFLGGGVVMLIWHIQRATKGRRSKCIQWAKDAAALRPGWQVDDRVANTRELDISGWKEFVAFRGLAAHCHVAVHMSLDGNRSIMFVPHDMLSGSRMPSTACVAIYVPGLHLPPMQVVWNIGGSECSSPNEEFLLNADSEQMLLPDGGIYSSNQLGARQLLSAEVKAALRSEMRLQWFETTPGWLLAVGEDLRGPDSFLETVDAATALTRAVKGAS